MCRTRCCCCSLQTGGIVLSILGIIAGFLTLSIGISEDAWLYKLEGAVCIAVYGILLGGSVSYKRNLLLVGLFCQGILAICHFAIVVISVASIELFFPRYANDCALDPPCEPSAWSPVVCISCDVRRGSTIAGVVSKYIVYAIVSIIFWVCYYNLYQEISKGGPEGGGKVLHPSNVNPVQAQTVHHQQPHIVGQAGMIPMQVTHAEPIQQPGFAQPHHQVGYQPVPQQPVFAPPQQQYAYPPLQQQPENAPPAYY